MTDSANSETKLQSSPQSSPEPQDAPVDSSADSTLRPASFEMQPILAYVEIDRFCSHCAYNLRGRPVRREAITQLLLTNCPECGRLAEANQATVASFPWLKRFSSAALLFWAFGLVLLPFWETGIQVVITIATAEEARWYLRYATRRGYDANWEMILMFVATVVGSMALSAFIVGLLTVVAPHWKRWGYYTVILARPPLVVALTAIAWSLGMPRYFEFVLPFLALSFVAIIAGGFLGLFLARPLTRLVLRLALPKRFILPLAYLWLVDDKTPPGTK